MPWYVWGRLWVGGWGVGVGESATSHTGSNLQNKCAERKEGKAKGLKSGEVAFEQALVPDLALAYTHEKLPLRVGIIKIPLWKRVAYSSRLCCLSLPRSPLRTFAGSLGEQVIEIFLELKSNFSAVSVVSVLLTLQMTSSAARANSSTMQICVFPSAIVLRWSNRRSAVELKELIRSFKLLGNKFVLNNTQVGG